MAIQSVGKECTDCGRRVTSIWHDCFTTDGNGNDVENIMHVPLYGVEIVEGGK